MCLDASCSFGMYLREIFTADAIELLVIHVENARRGAGELLHRVSGHDAEPLVHQHEGPVDDHPDARWHGAENCVEGRPWRRASSPRVRSRPMCAPTISAPVWSRRMSCTLHSRRLAVSSKPMKPNHSPCHGDGDVEDGENALRLQKRAQTRVQFFCLPGKCLPCYQELARLVIIRRVDELAESRILELRFHTLGARLVRLSRAQCPSEVSMKFSNR